MGRTEDKENTHKKRTPIKSAANTKKKPNSAQKSVGISKAKRGANTAARRGLSPSPRPTNCQIEKEVNRQQRNGNGSGPNNRQGQGQGARQSSRIQDRANNRGNKKISAPPKNAVDAALR